MTHAIGIGSDARCAPGDLPELRRQHPLHVGPALGQQRRNHRIRPEERRGPIPEGRDLIQRIDCDDEREGGDSNRLPGEDGGGKWLDRLPRGRRDTWIWCWGWLGLRFSTGEGSKGRHAEPDMGSGLHGGETKRGAGNGEQDARARRRYSSDSPPSTTMVWPVTCRASSEQRKVMTCATSSGSATRPSTLCLLGPLDDLAGAASSSARCG